MSEKTKRISRIILTNTIRFGLILGFVLGFAALFGQTNVLAGVALVVGLLMFPVCDLWLRRAFDPGLVSDMRDRRVAASSGFVGWDAD